MSATLTVNAIDLHYGAAQALYGISIEAKPGRITAVLGRNGSANPRRSEPSPASTM